MEVNDQTAFVIGFFGFGVFIGLMWLLTKSTPVAKVDHK